MNNDLITKEIANKIVKAKCKLELNKTMYKSKDDGSKPDSYNKVLGNIVAYTFRYYIKKILKEEGLDLVVSETNSFINGCPVEWDLLVVRKGAKCTYNNIYNAEDVVVIFEFKASGVYNKNLSNLFSKQTQYLNLINKREKKPILFGYVTFCEKNDFYYETVKYFDDVVNNHKKYTTFVFTRYKDLKVDQIPESDYFYEYYKNENNKPSIFQLDFRKYIVSLVKKSEK